MESPGRKRKAFTVKEKLDTLARVKSGVTQMQVARELGIENISFLVQLSIKDKKRKHSSTSSE